MSPVTHFLSGWVIANTAHLDPRDRAIVTLACVVPDIDGLGIVPELLTRHSDHPLLWFSLYHHTLHNLAFSLVVMAFAFFLSRRRATAALLAMVSFHVHLFEDLLGSRGPDGDQWAIPYLSPFSDRLNLVWRHQWALNAWPNFAITFALLTFVMYLAWRQGYSPVEMFSRRADEAFVATLRQRIPKTELDDKLGHT